MTWKVILINMRGRKKSWENISQLRQNKNEKKSSIYIRSEILFKYFIMSDVEFEILFFFFFKLSSTFSFMLTQEKKKLMDHAAA